MPMPPVDINLLAVFVAGVTSMVVGALWYSPMIFGKIWMTMSHIDEKKMKEMKKKGLGKSYGMAFVGSLVMSYVLAHFVDYTQSNTAMAGAQTGFWLWLGFVAPVLMSSVLWEGKSMKLYLLNVGQLLVSLLIMGAILAVWV